jgi:death on curing protein
VIYLQAEDILAIHDETIEKEGGLLGVRDMGLLFSVAERPKMAMMGQEFFPDVFSKAAAILEGIATYHVFSDGNKRTAFLSCATFLGLNGQDLVVSQKAGLQFMLAVAQKRKSLPEIAQWLKKYSS